MDEFWRSTPGQISQSFRAQDLRRRREHNDRMELAWHGAYLARVDPKKFPPLKKLQVNTDLAGRKFIRQDPEARWRALTAAASLSRKH